MSVSQARNFVLGVAISVAIVSFNYAHFEVQILGSSRRPRLEGSPPYLFGRGRQRLPRRLRDNDILKWDIQDVSRRKVVRYSEEHTDEDFFSKLFIGKLDNFASGGGVGEGGAPRKRRRGKTCKDVYEMGRVQENMTEKMRIINQFVRDRKENKDFIPGYVYDAVSSSVPHMAVQLNDTTGFSGTNITVADRWRFEQSGGRLPFLPCRLRWYDEAQVDSCCRGRRARGLTTHLAFIGDSRIRMHVEWLLDHVRHLHPTITTYSGEVLTVEDFLGEKGFGQWRKYKHNFRVETEAGLLVEFMWAPVLQHKEQKPYKGDRTGALGYLKRLTTVPDHQLPDLILLDTGAWQLMSGTNFLLTLIDQTTVEMMQVLRPILRKLAQRTQVVWALPDPFKEYMSHDFSGRGHFTQQTNTVLEWLTSSQTVLQPPGVMSWDTFLPVSYAAHADSVSFTYYKVDQTLLPRYSNFSEILTWEFSERMHVGVEALEVAGQMTLNHVCNAFVSSPPGKEYCCSDPRWWGDDGTSSER